MPDDDNSGDWFERHRLVPAGDERCDVCAGDRDRPKPKPGERWSVRETVGTMCEACREDLIRDVNLGAAIDELQPPADPSSN
jgi:hypothetical protein